MRLLGVEHHLLVGPLRELSVWVVHLRLRRGRLGPKVGAGREAMLVLVLGVVLVVVVHLRGREMMGRMLGST